MKKKSKNYLFSFCSLFLIGILGCSHPRLESVFDNQAFLEQVNAKNPPIHTLKANANIIISSERKTYRFKAGLLFSEKGSFFVETYGFGVPQGYALLAENKLTIWIPSYHSVYVGNRTSSLQKLLNADISADVLFEPILRQFTLSDGGTEISVIKRNYVITNAQKHTYIVDSSKWIRGFQKKSSTHVDYGSPRTDIAYPSMIEFKLKNGFVKMIFEDVKLNQPIENKMFQMDLPSSGLDLYTLD